MIQRNIIIFEFNSLYQILNEINDYLMFNIMNQNQKNIEQVNLNNSIVLTKLKYKEFLLIMSNTYYKQKNKPTTIIIKSKIKFGAGGRISLL